MKKVLFIDRDGTLILEPPVDFQVDSLEKLDYYPEVFFYLKKIVDYTDFEIVMVSNQDGLGTSSFPLEGHEIVHEKFLKTFRSQGIIFDDIHIDDSMPEDNSPNRKPRLGMLKKYLDGDYDLQNSFVIGDRITDLQLAENLGAKAILLSFDDRSSDIVNNGLTDICVLKAYSWKDIAEYLIAMPRKATVYRATNETKIEIELNLDGKGISEIHTGLGFFDHMLEQIARHGKMDLRIKTEGDLGVDEHHTIEDTALALGEAFSKALGDKRGVFRYGFLLPMDESLAQVAIDFGGRNWLVWDAEFNREKVGDVPTEMFYHFFKSFSDSAKCNLNIRVEGTNEHHKIEAIFKAFAKAIMMAVKRDVEDKSLPSTKGVI
ncbi:MAG: bifunctional histidinol-phosphatase/imidazoleglycerol-phosphate dehydratase HisB [Bacteroidales bacterium]|nr:bifunctional histidinol-phosphatase/imidazoleglycerol-phosphate dehydratase HisB [Bacteroidales bacterium]